MTAAPNVLIAGIGGASLGADYVPSVLALCRRLVVACIVPGGEAPTTLLARASGWRPPASGSRPTPLSYFGEPARPDAHTGVSVERVQPRQHQQRFGATPLVGARRWHDPGLQAADRR